MLGSKSKKRTSSTLEESVNMDTHILSEHQPNNPIEHLICLHALLLQETFIKYMWRKGEIKRISYTLMSKGVCDNRHMDFTSED